MSMLPGESLDGDGEAESIAPRHPLTIPYWRSRRRMALASLLGLLLTQLWVILTPNITPAQADVISSLVWVYGAVIGAYMGFKMFERGFGKK